MIMLEEKLNLLRKRLKQNKLKIMIMGLGSVGGYLLDYLLSESNENVEIIVAGRNLEKMQSDVNIIKVSSLIRGKNKSVVKIVSDLDLNDVESIKKCINENTPDIIVNTSRAYSGLKYGSISWKHLRAYGIWTPLSIKYIKNIMQAHEEAGSQSIVINTSYSDATIPWLKSANKAYPDFGSGNLNHLIPRIKLAVAQKFDIKDFWNIDVTYATAHFHDVVISKEGQTEGVEQLIDISYNGKKIDANTDEIFKLCKIAMPVDAKRNMMNASSNFDIIKGIISAVCENKKVKLHCPGVFGEIGGYPVIIDGTGKNIIAKIDDSKFSLIKMREKNRQSIYLDGIEKIENGTLTYTDELIKKVHDSFGVNLVKDVPFENIESTAEFIIKEIIEKFKEQ